MYVIIQNLIKDSSFIAKKLSPGYSIKSLNLALQDLNDILNSLQLHVLLINLFGITG